MSLQHLVQQELEAGRLEQVPVDIGVMAAEEHRLSEPIPGPVGSVRCPERREEESTGHQPPEDIDEQLPVLLARYVRDRIERGDSLKGGVGKLEIRDVAFDELGRWDVPAGQLDLDVRDVDADDLEALGEIACGPETRATSQVENARTVGQPAHERSQHALPRISCDVATPFEIGVRQAVVAGRHDLLPRIPHARFWYASRVRNSANSSERTSPSRRAAASVQGKSGSDARRLASSSSRMAV